MGKSVILFGSPESIHMKRFVKLLLNKEDGFERVAIFNLSDMGKLTEEDVEFYQSCNIEIIYLKPNKYPNRKLGSVLNFLRRKSFLKKYLKNKEKFDYCLIHFCTWQSALWVHATKKHYKQITPVFWGSDVLRSKYLNFGFFRRFLSNANQIVLISETCRRVFNEKTKDRYRSKICKIQFPYGICERMLQQKDTDVSAVKKEFRLPQDRTLVFCGHTATRAERYEQMIAQLEKCKPETIAKCCFVFFMTYAPDDYRSYQQEIEERLKQSNLCAVVLKELIPQETVARLHYAASVHLTTITTDAFSCFLQEEIMAGNVIVYGKWLNYCEIETDEYFLVPFDSFEDIPQRLDDVIANLEEYLNSSEKNIVGLMNMNSEKAVKQKWKDFVFDAES